MDPTLEVSLHWFYVACMAAGVLYFWFLSRDPRGVPRYEYLTALMIALVSGTVYLSVALGYGKTVIGGTEVYYARYFDWVITTPLLLLALAWTAMHRAPRKDKTLIAALMGTDAFMILTGLVADLTTGPARYVYYSLGVVAFLVILAMIWGPLRRIAQEGGADLAGVFRRVAGLLTVLWILYPTFWILGPSGINAIGQTASTMGFIFTPILSKVVWSIVDLHSLRALKAREEFTRAVPAPGD
ncbi:bacteriorhodopsin [Deinococcus planocerae]|uniref:bacteriorhodopsin n=1 Tax=Deinococcus planocerae TaxID=1737569 RepID=UPI000C7EFED4|nr:bacteriorhodopsin [Deinococcus planocerae]